mgnify:CR=1 FL=1
MGYMMSWNANEITESQVLDSETQQQQIESLQLSDEEKAELDVE